MPNTPQYGRGQVLEIINTVIDKMDAGTANRRDMFKDLAELAGIIDSLKKDIASHGPNHVKNSHIPDAHDELGAIVEATAEATNNIMTTCENIEMFAKTLETAQAETLVSHVTQIYEACTFQDITGQRIAKIVSTLSEIELRIDRIMSTLDEKVGPIKMAGGRLEKDVSVEDEKSLLNGPQMAGKGVSQLDIDKLLAEFDK